MEPPDIAGFTQAFQARFEAGDSAVTGKTHEQRLVDAVRRQFDALGQGDLAAFLEEMHPDVELEIGAPPAFRWVRKARGLQELRSAVEHNFSVLQDQHAELVSIVAQGNDVVVIGRERGRIRASGDPYDVCFVYQFTFRDGKMWRVLEIAADRIA